MSAVDLNFEREVRSTQGWIKRYIGPLKLERRQIIAEALARLSKEYQA